MIVVKQAVARELGYDFFFFFFFPLAQHGEVRSFLEESILSRHFLSPMRKNLIAKTLIILKM